MKKKLLGELAESTKQGDSQKQFVLCLSSKKPKRLMCLKFYEVIPDAAAAKRGKLRIVDETGELSLFPADYFIFIELPDEVIKALTRLV